MGQVSAAGFPADSVLEFQSSPANPQSTQRHELATAINVINQSGAIPADREVTFSTDSATRKLVVQVVDRQSRQVVVQWPSEYALQMAQDYRKGNSTR